MVSEIIDSTIRNQTLDLLRNHINKIQDQLCFLFSDDAKAVDIITRYCISEKGLIEDIRQNPRPRS